MTLPKTDPAYPSPPATLASHESRLLLSARKEMADGSRFGAFAERPVGGRFPETLWDRRTMPRGGAEAALA